jgi:hypothetical protein
MTAVRGRLLGAGFIQSDLRNIEGTAEAPATILGALEVWSERRDATLGPASSVRAITDAAVIPLLRILGFQPDQRADSPSQTQLTVTAGSLRMPVVVVPWGESLDSVWRTAVLDGIRSDSRWCLCCNGIFLRIVDARHTWNRHHLEFDLARLASDTTAAGVLWSVARADAMSGTPAVLDVAVARSIRHGLSVCKMLGKGVLLALSVLFEALSRRRLLPSGALFEQALTVLYRVLFLLFAEARGLVPVWHPVYRERYTIDAIVSALLGGRGYRGIWQAVLAISRLAHAGCAAGELKVTPFNGRLFAPSHSTAFDRTRIADDVMEKAVMAVGTITPPGGGRSRIHYGDLDVEQLGAVYEQVLEYAPGGDGPEVLTRMREQRRSTGTFYTPRAVTAHLVRRTLEPLVRDRSAEDILRLRILDPAMGSGAFLVGACRYLSTVLEERLILEGRWHAGDVTASDRATLRRDVAQRCLFGVDVNPMAVQLARLSLWLATLASDKPLTFLDHHLAIGDSLVGAGLDDIRRQPPGGRRRRRTSELPLFDDISLSKALEHATRTRRQMASEPDDTPAVVASKERALAVLSAPGSPQRRWREVFDLWCAGWYWERGAVPGSGVFGELTRHVLDGASALPKGTAASLLEHASELSERQRFFHWPLAFPEVFAAEASTSTGDTGFDAVIGNPPWDMVRGDSGDAEDRLSRKDNARRFNDFVREAGVYRTGGRSHANRYQLFVERALQLVRAGGRVGLVLPSGIVNDTGAASLRRHLFDRAAVDWIAGLDNRNAIFPIHRSVRFVLMACTAGTPTSSIRCRFGMTRPEELDDDRRAPLVITRPLLCRISGGDDLGIPEMVTERDLRILEDVTSRIPWLGAAEGWAARFGRELNATDDKDLFRPYTGSRDVRPVLEGKQIEPFRTSFEACRYELNPGADAPHVSRRARLAYRDVASATNRLTLIAAVIPAAAVTTHTLFCLRNPLSIDAHWVLCALLNSFVANYFVRMRVTTHVTASLMSRLPAPVLGPHDSTFATLARLSRALATAAQPVDGMPEYAELQAIVFALYGLSHADAEHVLGTFPLIGEDVKERTLRHLQLSVRAR